MLGKTFYRAVQSVPAGLQRRKCPVLSLIYVLWVNQHWVGIRCEDDQSLQTIRQKGQLSSAPRNTMASMPSSSGLSVTEIKNCESITKALENVDVQIYCVNEVEIS